MVGQFDLQALLKRVLTCLMTCCAELLAEAEEPGAVCVCQPAVDATSGA